MLLLRWRSTLASSVKARTPLFHVPVGIGDSGTPGLVPGCVVQGARVVLHTLVQEREDTLLILGSDTSVSEWKDTRFAPVGCTLLTDGFLCRGFYFCCCCSFYNCCCGFLCGWVSRSWGWRLCLKTWSRRRLCRRTRSRWRLCSRTRSRWSSCWLCWLRSWVHSCSRLAPL